MLSISGEINFIFKNHASGIINLHIRCIDARQHTFKVTAMCTGNEMWSKAIQCVAGEVIRVSGHILKVENDIITIGVTSMGE